ncbi:uncharacterized protein LOC135085422 [Ostrinia nubilalis]|uniref:uncharacterized protein LOC135085422 n=1 Tax=Ostrinia nubilalis TaxID=29057 RepID=UPI0030825DC8
MDDRMEFQRDTTRNYDDTTSKWQRRAASAMSFESGESGNSYTPQDQHLQYFPEKETRSYRQFVPASWHETLSYYRGYVTAASKTQIYSPQYYPFNIFFWQNLMNLLFKSLPLTYVYMFLASYSANHHFFLPKMIPIAYGVIIIFIITAFLEIMLFMDFIIFLFHYTIRGFVDKNPWHRCDNKEPINMGSYNIYGLDVRLYGVCVTLKEYQELQEVFEIYYPFPAPTFYFIQTQYALLSHSNSDRISQSFIYFVILWIFINLFYCQLFSKMLWKIHHIFHWITNIIFIIVLSHLMLRDLFVKLEDDNSSQEGDPTTKLKSDLMWHNDLNMIALSMATPPIVHILTSRTNKEINANRDSSILLISNGIYSILKGLLSHKVKKYSQSILKETIDMEILHEEFFKIWTVYFSTFFLGDLFSITFFGIHFIVETLNVVITSQCLIEAIVCEWRVAKRLFVSFIFFILGIVVFYLSTHESRIGFYMYTQHVVTLLEIFVIFFMYPLGRLIDDITFYTGVIPTQMRLYNLKGVPLYFAWKLYILLKFNTNWMKYIENDDNVYPDHLDYYFDVSIGIFLFIGVLYAAVKNLYFYKKTWRSLLVPESNWGPEYSIRQLRKQYDSREYIGSQAPRPLSRYMIYKAEAKKYSLNIKYPSVTSDASSEVRYENEKKNV